MSKKHRNKYVTASLAASLVATAGFVIDAQAADFNDIDNSYHADAIKNLTDAGAINGYGDGTYRPDELLTRGQAVKIIVHSLGLENNKVENPNFSDVTTDHMFYKEIAILKSEGYLTGYPDKTFKPDATITRGELAKILVAAYDLKVDDKVNVPFTDVQDSYFAPFISTIYSYNVTKGVSETEFGPNQPVTRGQMATFAVRADNNAKSSGKDFDLTILHTNDTHARTDLYPKLATAVKAEREANKDAVLVDAGDVFSGTLYFSKYEGQADISLMNYIGYDVMTLGNHEFDLGATPNGHQALADFIAAAKFPFISSNVDASADDKLKGLFSDVISSKPADGKVYQGMVKEINGEKVGFFALTTAETEFISSPVNVKFNDYLETAQNAVNAFEKMGINKIVAVTHIGYDDNANYDNDLLLAEFVDGIDVIVGGHSHTKLEKETLIEKDEPTVIVQTGEYLGNLGKLDVTFDKNGVVKAQEGQLIALEKVAEDEKALEILAPYKEGVKALEQEEIGVNLPIALDNPRDGGDDTKPSVRKNQTILGNLVTEGMLSKAQEVATSYNKKVVMAIQNGGGIRAAINEGPVTVGEVRSVLPFGNTLAMMDVTGTELKEGFEIALSQYPKENGGFLHVAGGFIKYDSSLPAGERVVSISYKDADGNLVEMQDDELYTVATNAFTAKGGDGFTPFATAYAEGRVTDFGLNDWENFRDYLIEIKDEIPTTLDVRYKDLNNGIETTPIADARKLANGTQVEVTGVVTGFAGTVWNITDETGSISLYNSSITDLKIGETVTVVGKLGAYKNHLQVGSFQIVDRNNKSANVTPQVIAGKQVSEEKEAAYATVKKVSITKDLGASKYTATTEDGGSFVVTGTGITLEVGKTYDAVTGHVIQVNDDYQIVVANPSDIVLDETVAAVPTASQTAKLIAAGTKVELNAKNPNAKIYYTLDGSEPTTNSTLYTGAITVNEKTTIKAISVVEGLQTSPVATFSYDVYDAAKGLQIHDVQGTTHESPLAGSKVSVSGVVTGTYELGNNKYFYIQTPDQLADNNPNTSEGIVVFAGSKALTVAVGNLVTVEGEVSEYYIDGSSSKASTDLTVTQINTNITGGKITVDEQSVELPAPVKITDENLNQTAIKSAPFNEFNPQKDALDFWETLEGMRVETGTVRVTGPQEYGEFYSVLDTVAATTKNGGMLLTEATASPNLINFRLYNDAASKTVAESVVLKTGDKFNGPIVGHVNYGYSNYKVVVDYDQVKAGLVKGSNAPETSTSIAFDENKLTIASYNVENFSANKAAGETSDEKAARVAQAIKTLNADIVGLIEIQDNDGQTASGSSAADQSFQRLIDAIVAAGGPKYEYVNIDPQYDKDGGAPGANIRPGFLYNPDRVTFNQVGTVSNTVGAEYGETGLVNNPALIDPTSSIYTASRKPLVAQFNFKGEDVIVIGNHWNSKSGDLPTWGKNQPVTLASEAQRVTIAQSVGNFVSSVKAKNPNANIVALGDFNDFQWSKPLKTFEGYGMYNMIHSVPSAERYTYNYQGNSQVLDHILVSENLKANTVIDILNVNADFTEEEGRASDHNPVMVQMKLK